MSNDFFIFDKSGTILEGVKSKIMKSAIIPDSVTSIGDEAFRYCDRLTSVTIPDSVTTIGKYAFANCSSLASINIPDKVTCIGDEAFFGCIGLTSVTIPESVTTIGRNPFARCTGLISISVRKVIGPRKGKNKKAPVNPVYDSRNNCNAIIEKSSNTLISGCVNTVIPDGVTSIGDDAFSGCSGLTSIIIPVVVTSIGDDAFSGCSGLTYVIIPECVTSIGDDAFSGCSGLTSIIIPEGVTGIGWNAFSYCHNLNLVYIPESMTYIPDSAFSGCTNLKSVIIPDSVTSIGTYAFSGCVGLTSVTIPNSVYRIRRWAFKDCINLTTVNFNNRVPSIEDEAFLGCTSLKSITRGNDSFSIEVIPSGRGLEILLERGSVADKYGVVFSADKRKLLKAPKGLIKYTIPQGTIVICEGAFTDCRESLACVIIPDSVREIENNAFSKQAYLTLKNMDCLEVPSTVKKIGSRAFVGLKKVCYKGDADHNGSQMWGAEMLVDGKPAYEGTLPWGRWDSRDGYSDYYQGQIKNGVPHGYGGVYEIDKSGWGNDRLLYSGRWVNGVYQDPKSPLDRLTDEEWRHIN
ncbi:MAG: leucine-rich repeat domain-containing protein [Muribaculaceae bacterium]|nr:leucine-rich repeat domain-containing protein [Muribaculaceae bacterium]